MIVDVKNRLPVIETALLSIVFLGATEFALINTLTISQQNINLLLSVWFWAGTVSILLILAGVLKYRKKQRGSLKIDVETKTFSLNSSKFMSYKELTFFKSSLVQGLKTGPYSNMSIVLGTKEHGQFHIIDADRFYFKPAGRTAEELEALRELVNGSSFTETEKESFSNWFGRASLVLETR